MAKDKKKFTFRWSDGVEPSNIWAFDIPTAWDNATRFLRPASMRDSADDVVRDYLKEHGDVVELEAT